MRFSTRVTFGLPLLLGGLTGAVSAAPLGPAFTYQGQLKSGSSPLTGTADFQFSLWDSPDTDCATPDGAQIGLPQTISNVSVTDGLFTVELNTVGQVTATPFDGSARWLQIAVRSPAGTGAYTTLCPRQPLTAAPHALGLRYPFTGSFAGTDQIAMAISQTGIGDAGSFTANHAGNYWDALGVSCSGTGPSLFVTHSAGGSCARLQNTVVDNNSPTLHATTRGSAAALLGDAATGTNGTGVSGVGHGTGHGVRSNADGSGSAGYFQITSAASSAAALYCTTTGTGPALLADGKVGIDEPAPAAKLHVSRPISDAIPAFMAESSIDLFGVPVTRRTSTPY